MSSFNCEHCGTAIIDTPDGYVTECEHYPLLKSSERVQKKEYMQEIWERMLIKYPF